MARQCILFVDDDVLTQWVMTEVLVHGGFDVVSACRGTEAVDLLAEAAGFDLMLSDVDLADGVSGTWLGDHWRRALPNRPVIYMGYDHSRMAGVLEPHESFLHKPFDAARLLQCIDTALEDAALRAFLPAPFRRSHHVH